MTEPVLSRLPAVWATKLLFWLKSLLCRGYEMKGQREQLGCFGLSGMWENRKLKEGFDAKTSFQTCLSHSTGNCSRMESSANKVRTSNRTKRPHIHRGMDHDILAIRVVSKRNSSDVHILSPIDVSWDALSRTSHDSQHFVLCAFQLGKRGRSNLLRGVGYFWCVVSLITEWSYL